VENLVVVYDGVDAGLKSSLAAAIGADGKVVDPRDGRMIEADLYLFDARRGSDSGPGSLAGILEAAHRLRIPTAVVSAYLDDWITDLVMRGEVVGFLEATGNQVLLRIRLMDILSRLEG
jgi:hypothetical protein